MLSTGFIFLSYICFLTLKNVFIYLFVYLYIKSYIAR